MVFPLRVHQIVVMIVFLILFANDATAQLAIIQLHHRPAEEIIPVIAPLLNPADRISGQGFQTQQIQTRVQGRLNEWIDLGAIISGAFREGTGIAHGASAQESSRSHIFVRVEAVP